MRYIFIVGSRAVTGRQRSVSRLIQSHFGGQENLLLLDPPDLLIDNLCRTCGPEELRLIAAGGDGTVHRLLPAAVRYGIPIGILPCGTANDLARAIGLKRSIKECCRVILEDRVRNIDLIAVNENLFATCGGLGLPSSVAIRHNCSRKSSPRPYGKGFRKTEYLLEALRVLGRKHSVQVRIRGSHPRWSGGVMAVVVSNQARFGALFSVSHDAVNDDGAFDLCVIPDPVSRFRELGIMFRAVLGKGATGPGIIRNRLHRTRILTVETVPFFGDGEILLRGRDFRIKVLPRALRLIVPVRVSVEEVHPRRLSPNWFHSGIGQFKRYRSGKTVLVRPRCKQNI